MVDRGGWMRIVEASIAIMLVASVLLVLLQKPKQIQNENFDEFMFSALEEISKNVSLREKIIAGGDVLRVRAEIDNFFDYRARREGLKVRFEICPIDSICSMPVEIYSGVSGAIYSREIIMSSTIYKYSPKKIKIFVWKDG